MMTRAEIERQFDLLLMNQTLDRLELFDFNEGELRVAYEQARKCMSNEEAWSVAVFSLVRRQWLDMVMERQLQKAADQPLADTPPDLE